MNTFWIFEYLYFLDCGLLVIQVQGLYVIPFLAIFIMIEYILLESRYFIPSICGAWRPFQMFYKNRYSPITVAHPWMIFVAFVSALYVCDLSRIWTLSQLVTMFHIELWPIPIFFYDAQKMLWSSFCKIAHWRVTSFVELPEKT